MTDGRRDNPEDGPREQGEAVPLNWGCTVCGYRVEGELPEKCPECGADRREFDEIPLPGF
ncbi:MAG: rubredoxin-like domain-containing protein [Rubrobacteraceae bacterium]